MVTKLSASIGFDASEYLQTSQQIIAANQRIDASLDQLPGSMSAVEDISFDSARAEAIELANSLESIHAPQLDQIKAPDLSPLVDSTRQAANEMNSLGRAERILEALALRSNDLAAKMSDLTRRIPRAKAAFDELTSTDDLIKEVEIKTIVDDRGIDELEQDLQSQRSLAKSLEKDYQRLGQRIKDSAGNTTRVAQLESQRAQVAERLGRVQKDAVAVAGSLARARAAEAASTTTATQASKTYAAAAKQASNSSGKLGNAAQQLAYGFDDFQSSTGDLTNRLRGVSNNVAAMAASFGPVAGVAAVAGTALVKYGIHVAEVNEAHRNAEQTIRERIDSERSLISVVQTQIDLIAQRRQLMGDIADARKVDIESLNRQTQATQDNIQSLKDRLKVQQDAQKLSRAESELKGIEDVVQQAGLEGQYSDAYDEGTRENELLKRREAAENKLALMQTDRQEAEIRATKDAIALRQRALRAASENAVQAAEDYRNKLQEKFEGPPPFDASAAEAAGQRLVEINKRRLAIESEIKKIQPYSNKVNVQERLRDRAEEIKTLADEEFELRKKLVDRQKEQGQLIEKANQAKRQMMMEERNAEIAELEQQIQQRQNGSRENEIQYPTQASEAVMTGSSEAQQIMADAKMQGMAAAAGQNQPSGESDKEIIAELKNAVAELKQMNQSQSKGGKGKLVALEING